MSEQDKIILDDLVEQIKSGKTSIDDLPNEWKEKVVKVLEEGKNNE